jgi:Protein of unknown function (DUF2630)
MTIRNVQLPGDKADVPADLSLFARVEGLVGEEKALLEIPRPSRQQRDRLREVGAELDHIWEALRARRSPRGRVYWFQRSAVTLRWRWLLARGLVTSCGEPGRNSARPRSVMRPLLRRRANRLRKSARRLSIGPIGGRM